MKTTISLFAVILALTVLNSACGSLRGSNSTTGNTTNPIANSNTAANDKKEKSSKDSAPADFKLTAEELGREFTRTGVREDDLKKYINKTIEVTGRIWLLEPEGKTLGPYVSLGAPGLVGGGVNCYFDSTDVGQLSGLKKDEMVTLRGFQNDIPTVGAVMLERCQVVETKKPAAGKIVNPDFTMTPDEMERIFTRKDAKDSDFEKYEHKIFQVTGRISHVSLEKSTVQPSIHLGVLGASRGVSCSFDDEDLDQMKDLKEGQTVTVQGYRSLVIARAALLDHCQIMPAK
jgi:hypothetical protein